MEQETRNCAGEGRPKLCRRRTSGAFQNFENQNVQASTVLFLPNVILEVNMWRLAILRLFVCCLLLGAPVLGQCMQYLKVGKARNLVHPRSIPYLFVDGSKPHAFPRGPVGAVIGGGIAALAASSSKRSSVRLPSLGVSTISLPLGGMSPFACVSKGKFPDVP